MERRKNELDSSLHQIKSECEAIFNNLQDILQEQSDDVNNIKAMSNSDLLKNSTYFLSVHKTQQNILQKVMSISLDVENYLDELKKEKFVVLTTLNSAECNSSIRINKDTSTSPKQILCSPIINKETSSNDNVDLERDDKTQSPWKKVEEHSDSKCSELNLIKPIKFSIKAKEFIPNQASVFGDIAGNDKLQRNQNSDSSKLKNEQLLNEQSSASNSKLTEKLVKTDDRSQARIKSILDAPIPEENNDCVIVSYISPGKFFINLKNNVMNMTSISEKIMKTTKNESQYYKKKIDLKKASNNYCVYYYKEEKTWYRVEVIDWMENQDTVVKIYFIDVGWIITVSYKELQKLPEGLFKTPKCAIQCALAYLYPPNSTKDNLLTEWPKESLDAFRKFLEDSNFAYNVAYVEQKGNCVLVDLASDLNEDVTLGEELIKGGYAREIIPVKSEDTAVKDKFMIKQIMTAQGLGDLKNGMSDSEVLSRYLDNITLNEETDNIVEAVTGYNAQDEARICKFGLKCRKKNCQMEHEELRKDGVTTDKKFIFKPLSSNIPAVNVGDKLDIFITHVVSVTQFYAHLRTFDPNNDLKRLVNLMNLPANVMSYKYLKLLPSSGEVIIAKHWDQRWHRAMVVDITNITEHQELVRVFFVDFGDVGEVPLRDCREIEEKYMILSFKAVKCILHNIKPSDNKNMEEAKEYFESRYLCTPLTATVMYFGFGHLDLVVYDSDNNDISAEIIEDEFAVPCLSNNPNLTENSLLVE